MECKCETCIRKDCPERTTQDDLRVVIGCDDYIEHKITNADRIRSMSDEELAHFMAERSVNEYTVNLLDKDAVLTAVQIEALKHNIYCSLMQWLKQPAED